MKLTTVYYFSSSAGVKASESEVSSQAAASVVPSNVLTSITSLQGSYSSLPLSEYHSLEKESVSNLPLATTSDLQPSYPSLDIQSATAGVAALVVGSTTESFRDHWPDFDSSTATTSKPSSVTGIIRRDTINTSITVGSNSTTLPHPRLESDCQLDMTVSNCPLSTLSGASSQVSADESNIISSICPETVDNQTTLSNENNNACFLITFNAPASMPEYRSTLCKTDSAAISSIGQSGNLPEFHILGTNHTEPDTLENVATAEDICKDVSLGNETNVHLPPLGSDPSRPTVELQIDEMDESLFRPMDMNSAHVISSVDESFSDAKLRYGNVAADTCLPANNDYDREQDIGVSSLKNSNHSNDEKSPEHLATCRDSVGIAPVPTAGKLGKLQLNNLGGTAYKCYLCYVTFESEAEIAEHVKSSRHLEMVLVDSGAETLWWYPPPPPSLATQEYTLCQR